MRFRLLFTREVGDSDALRDPSSERSRTYALAGGAGVVETLEGERRRPDCEKSLCLDERAARVARAPGREEVRNLRGSKRLSASSASRAADKAVRKCLGLIESNPRHPGLQTHEFRSLQGPGGERVFEAYAEQGTPAAYRVFWCYGPGRQQITIIAITPHP